MSHEQEVRVPDIGDFKNVPVIAVLVKPGDRINVDTPVIVLETDKATMEVPSTSAGVVRSLAVKAGDKLNKGDPILIVAAEHASGAPVLISESTGREPVAPPAAPAAGSSLQIVTVPDLGDFKNVPVIEILVKPGETVAKDTPLLVLESDKATMEVPSPSAGVVVDIAVKMGDRLNKGDRVLTLDAKGPTTTSADAPPTPAHTISGSSASAPATEPAKREVPVSSVAKASDPSLLPPASPMIRKLARELGVDLLRVTGSGPRGRILRENVERYVRQELSRPPSADGAPSSNGPLAGLLPWPKVDFAKFGSVERQPLVRLRKISGANLSRNWVMIPHVTNFDEADITEIEAFRQQVNREQKADAPKLTLLSFLIKASVEVLRRFPEYNASLDGDELVMKRYFHIGFAADTPNGLVVPVIRDADKKGLREIAAEASELAALARGGKLKPEHMQGGCFSISSLGGIGGTGFTPIINAPEVAILGVTKAEYKPKWDGKQFQPRLMVPLNLSWDHRVVDGASAARFLVTLCSLLSDFRRVCL